MRLNLWIMWASRETLKLRDMAHNGFKLCRPVTCRVCIFSHACFLQWNYLSDSDFSTAINLESWNHVISDSRRLIPPLCRNPGTLVWVFIVLFCGFAVLHCLWIAVVYTSLFGPKSRHRPERNYCVILLMSWAAEVHSENYLVFHNIKIILAVNSRFR